MKITIDQSVLDKYGLTLEEFMVMYLSIKPWDIKELVNSIISKGLAGKNLFNDTNVVLSHGEKQIIHDIIIESDRAVIDKDEEFRDLAEKLKELYPPGRKSGTTYMWRGTTTEIAKKLKTLVVKYNCKFTPEQAIEATRKYVESFNGNYKNMRLLKYFILKSVKDADDNVNVLSDMMSLIENEGQDNINNDWAAELR